MMQLCAVFKVDGVLIYLSMPVAIVKLGTYYYMVETEEYFIQFLPTPLTSRPITIVTLFRFLPVTRATICRSAYSTE